MDHSVVLDLIRQFGSSVVAIAHQLHAGERHLITTVAYAQAAYLKPKILQRGESGPIWIFGWLSTALERSIRMHALFRFLLEIVAGALLFGIIVGTISWVRNFERPIRWIHCLFCVINTDVDGVYFLRTYYQVGAVLSKVRLEKLVGDKDEGQAMTTWTRFAGEISASESMWVLSICWLRYISKKSAAERGISLRMSLKNLPCKWNNRTCYRSSALLGHSLPRCFLIELLVIKANFQFPAAQNTRVRSMSTRCQYTQIEFEKPRTDLL